jgi:outer membrane protein with beta-barrel domain
VRRIVLLIAGLALAAPAAAQEPPALSIRPFVMATEQSFAAIDTFDAAFGKTLFPFFGGGVQVVVHDGFFAEVGASRFRQAGQRAYLSGGKAFPLGIPLTATITPLEITGGYRFRLRQLPRVRPYAAAGFGSYAYQETSGFAEAGEDVDTRHSGYVLNGGAEFRLHAWVGLAIDVQYSHVPGILGAGGVSQQAGESDLGGVSARFKLVVGR